MSAGDSPLVLSGTSAGYGTHEVLAGLDLRVAHHEFLAFVGPSGCGKTTLLALLAGHLAPTRGTLARTGASRMIYQDGGLFPWLTVGENIALGLRHLAPAAHPPQLAELVRLISLEGFADHYPHQLSGGMKQRVELARALAADADVLLMDEPFSALDYQTRLRMRRELHDALAARPRTVVLVTHDLEEAAQLADRVLVLAGKPATIRRELVIDAPRPRHPADPAVVDATRVLLDELGLS
jgi:NitT/TauT family transport system ATP-binding protein